jgi:phosphate transport system substrate-binding protein
LHLKKFTLHRRKAASLAVAALAASASTVFVSTGTALAVGSGSTLSGAGSSLVAPLVNEWAQAFQGKYGESIQYSSVGSGTGIKDITSGLVDFGASDAPLTPSQASACQGCVQIPWALSATAIGYHLNGFSGHIRLTAAALANIYLGKVKHWNDPLIAAANPGAHLPSTAITPIFRSDGSGDTYAFTDYLTRVSGGWRSQVGTGTSVQFPTGAGGTGNAGVTAVLQQTDGGIAYVAASYLIAHNLPAASIRNAAGKFEYPNLQNIENAARQVKSVPGSNELHIVNPPRKEKIAYPISTFTYAIVHTSAPNASLIRQWLLYALGPGQAFGQSLDFAPLPKVVHSAGKSTVFKIH